MALDPMAKVWARLAQIERLLRTRMLERSSITDGVMTFIRGRLRLLQGAVLEIVGNVIGSGTFDWSGPWNMSGDGDIAGNVNLDGDMTVRNGQVVVNGAVPIRLRQVSGSARVEFGDVGRIFSQNGVVILNGTDANIGVGNNSLLMNAAGKEIGVDSTGIKFLGIDVLPSGTDAEYLVIGTDGKLYRSPGMGGNPGGDPTPGEDLGNFQWPFALSTVTSEYGPRWGRMHEGIDFGLSPATAGAPIIAAGDGVVAVRTYSSGWGNYVRLTHTLPSGAQVSTLYAHMVEPAPVAVGQTVSKGDIIGHVGNTGNSFGAHLHFETWMSTSYGSHVNPRSFMAAYGPG